MAEPSRPDNLPGPPSAGKGRPRTTRAPKWLLPLLTVSALIVGVAVGQAASVENAETIDRLRAENARQASAAELQIDTIVELRTETGTLQAQIDRMGNQADDDALVKRLTDRVDKLERELEKEKKRQAGGGGGSGGGGGGEASGGGGGSAGARSFGDGTYRIPQDIDPGTYRASGGKNCYWERLSAFNGSLNSIIANGIGSPHPIVTIESSDAGFSSQRCGAWDRV